MFAFHIRTLGCRINQYETQALRESWLARGFTEAGDPGGADLIVVNSCAVTANAVADTRAALRSLARQAPGARLVVTGCACEFCPDDLAAIQGVERVVPQRGKAGLAAWPETPPAPGPKEFPDFALADSPRARALLKVQDGCSHGCSYCVVPSTRGPSRSRPPAEAVAEARRLLASGLREIVISGINLRHYGREWGTEWTLWRLVREMETELAPEWAGRARLRLSSLDPAQLTEEAADTLLGSRMLCPHLHLSLQSLSPTVLGRMNRGHTSPEAVADFVRLLGREVPVLGLGADFIAGFPGETEAEFAETLAAADELPLTYAHVFPYSRRPGTRAASMPDQVPGPEAKARAAALRKLAEAKKEDFLHFLAGMRHLEMVLEDPDAGTGSEATFAPCRLIEIPEWAAPRQLLPCRPEGVSGGAVLVRPDPPKENA
ncbi:MiaB/RimO family radical SAM methylthiotransferase [Desulfohalovibrio reitneri]|uniref:MiaB/RimO family radical SAM methylthiotransferase n=1 Tax=Desulfohalovibrio reitneri TaxID=1307759 RepID=UPI0004A78415|nr:MiaB/RimO family radical SAM methylthiotransferase [Desulfohalovibrio reitneri]